MRRLPFRFWCQSAAATICAVLLVVTISEPRWIEVLLHVEPDAGSGEAEWGVVLLLAAATAVLGGVTGRTWWKAAHAPG